MKDKDSIKNIFDNLSNDLLAKDKRCCFTGHRFISSDHIKRIEQNLSVMINALADCGVTEFIDGGALGFDMLAAKAVVRERAKNPDLRLILALPCVEHNRNWRAADIADFNRILSSADDIIYTSDNYYNGCMLRRNRYMVDKSRHCIFYMTSPRGGTAYTVRYALDAGLEMHNIMIPE